MPPNHPPRAEELSDDQGISTVKPGQHGDGSGHSGKKPGGCGTIGEVMAGNPKIPLPSIAGNSESVACTLSSKGPRMLFEAPPLIVTGILRVGPK